MSNTPAHAITLPMQPKPRTRGMLLTSATDIPDGLMSSGGTERTANGATWLPWGPIVISGDDVNCASVYEKDPRVLSAIADQPAFLLYDSLICSTLGMTLAELDRRVRVNMDDFISAVVMNELVTATLSGGLGLRGNGGTYIPTVVSATAVSLAVGMSDLQTSLNAKQAGARFTIFLTPGLLDIAVAYGLASLVGDHFETPTGHLVIGDAGFTGRAGQAVPGLTLPSSSEAWIYGSGEIFYRTTKLTPSAPIGGGESGNADVYVLQNKNRPLVERMGLLLFDPNILAAAKVTVAAL